MTIGSGANILGITRNLGDHTRNMNLYSKRLSTGLKINSASDGAANLSLSKKIQSSLSASEILKNNAATGINALETTDGDLSVIGGMLQRMRDLSVQGLNGVYSVDEKNILMNEANQLAYEIKRITQSSRFSDKNLFDSDTDDPLKILVGDTGSGDDYIDLSSISDNMLFTDVLAKDKNVFMLNMPPGGSYYVEFNDKLYQIDNTSATTKNLIYGYEEDLADQNNSITFVQDSQGVTANFVGPYQNDQVQMGNGERYLTIAGGQTSYFNIGNEVFSLANSDGANQTGVFETAGTTINMVSGANLTAAHQFTLSGYNTAVGNESAISLNGNEEKYINYAGRLYSITNNSASQETLVYRNSGGLQNLSGNVTTSQVGTISASTALNATNRQVKLAAGQQLFYSNAGTVYSLQNNTGQEQMLVLDSSNNIVNANASVTRSALSTTNGTIGMANPYSIDAVAGQKYYIKSADNSQIHELTATATGKLLVDFDGTNIDSIGGVGATLDTTNAPRYENVTPDGLNQFVIDLSPNSQESITIGSEVYKISNSGGGKNNISFTYDPIGKTITEDAPHPQITVDGYQDDLTSPTALNANDYYQPSLNDGQSTYMQIGADIFRITNSSGSATDSIMTYNAGAHTLSAGAGGVSATLITQASFTNNVVGDRSLNVNAGQTRIVQFGNDNFEIQNNSASASNAVFTYSGGNLTVNDPTIASYFTITKHVTDNASQTALAAGDMYTTLSAGGTKYLSAGGDYFNVTNTGGARTAVVRQAGAALSQIAGTGVNRSFVSAVSNSTLSTASDYYIEMNPTEQQYLKQGSYAYKLNNLTGSAKTDVFRQVGINLVSQNTSISETNLPVANQDNFSQLLPIVDWAMGVVNSKRSEIGSKIAALDQSINMNDNRRINLTAANSTIVDADIAQEHSSYVKTSILQNFTSTLLNQSKNINSDMVLKLLQ